VRPIDLARWWQSLDDPELNALIERAIQSNLDLKIALNRLQEARAGEYVVSGGTMPLVDLAGAAARSSGNDSTRGRIPGPIHSGANTAGLQEITHVAGFDAGWELDLFGRFRREVEAARADTQTAAEARNVVLISLISDVARAYTDTRALQLRLAVARENIRTQEQTDQFVRGRRKQGLANDLEVALADRQLATVGSNVAPLEAAIAESQRRAAVLLGMLPQELHAELQQPGNLPSPPERIEPGLPVALLRRRPDVRESERQLAASTARIGVATANLFPRVAITGAYGFQGQGLGRTPVENKMIWSLGPQAYWPLLDFGTIDALIEVQDFRTRELLYDYRRTVLRAVEEVDNAISNYTAQRDRLDQLGTALEASRQAVNLATQRYERGLTDFLNVLDAQRQLYELQDQYAVAQQAVVIQFIALYKALGGGWETYQKVPDIRHPQPAVLAVGREVLTPGRASTR
jgi:NodT family efflux transporter outer membrane factor (OMF) lipoprotein